MDSAHRSALAAASDDGTRLTRLFSGRPNRVIRTRFTEELRDAEDLVAPFPAQRSLVAPLQQAAGSTDFLSLLMGQAAPLSREMPAADLVHSLIAEVEEHLTQLNPGAGRDHAG